MGNSFSSSEYFNAREAFFKWQGSIDDTVDDYVLRQRKEELRQLVRKVIQNELSDYDKMLVDLRWYRNLSQNEIAEKLGIDRSTVTRHLEKINNIIYENLKYAIEFRYGKSFRNQSKIIIKSGDALNCTINAEDISGRIKKLRDDQFLSIDEVSELTGIRKSRLKQIERSGTDMTVTELKKLSTFFCCHTDYIVFGN